MKVTRIWHSGNGSYIELEQIDKIEEIEKKFNVDGIECDTLEEAQAIIDADEKKKIKEPEVAEVVVDETPQIVCIENTTKEFDIIEGKKK